MVTAVILVSVAVVTIAAAAFSYVVSKKAAANLVAIADRVEAQVVAYKKSVAAHLDILEATGTEEIKKIVADIRAKL
jgi:hypothetical protein